MHRHDTQLSFAAASKHNRAFQGPASFFRVVECDSDPPESAIFAPGIAKRRDGDGARGAAQKALANRARDDPPHPTAVRRPHDDQADVILLADALQLARRRVAGHDLDLGYSYPLERRPELAQN